MSTTTPMQLRRFNTEFWTKKRDDLLLKFWNEDGLTSWQIARNIHFQTTPATITGRIARLREKGVVFKHHQSPEINSVRRVGPSQLVHPPKNMSFDAVPEDIANWRNPKSMPLEPGHTISWGALWVGLSSGEVPPWPRT